MKQGALGVPSASAASLLQECQCPALRIAYIMKGHRCDGKKAQGWSWVQGAWIFTSPFTGYGA